LLCRNVLMYFTPEAQGHILERFNFALDPTGFLFLGKSEMLIAHGELFSPYDLKWRIFRKVQRNNQRERLAFVAPEGIGDRFEELQSTNEELETTNEELQSTNEELETMNEELQSTNDELETMNAQVNDRATELDRLNLFFEGILGSLRVSVIVIDPNHQIQVWNAMSDELWGLRRAEVEGQDLFQLDIG